MGAVVDSSAIGVESLSSIKATRYVPAINTVAGFAECPGPIVSVQQCVPTAFQRRRIRRDGPSPFELNTGMLPRHQIGQQRPSKVFALSRWTERRMPVVRAIPPLHLRKSADGVEHRELLGARAVDTGVADFGWRVSIRLLRASRHGNGDRCLNGKNVLAPARPATLAAEIENPDFVADPAHVLAHPDKGVAVQVARRRDETDDAGTGLGILLEDLPQRPAPEIYVEVVEVLELEAVTGSGCWLDEIAQDCTRAAIAVVAPAHPGAGAGAVGPPSPPRAGRKAGCRGRRAPGRPS